MRRRWSTGRFFEENIVSNHVLTEEIFSYLTKSELLECSLVSKKWISPCREFLYRHHECLLRVDARQLESVLATSKLLDDCKEIFYNGVFWNISKLYSKPSLFPDEMQDMTSTLKEVGSILKRLPTIQFLTLKTVVFEIVYQSTFSIGRHCRIDLTKIEKLKIIGGMNLKVYNSLFGKRVFPNLTVAHFPGWYGYGYNGFGGILQRVLSSSPLLQEWSSKIDESHIKYFAEANKLAVIKSFLIPHWTPSWRQLVDAIEAAKGVAFRRIDCYLDRTTENVEIFRRITVESTENLQKIKMRHEFCKMLVTTPGIRPFINVKEVAFTFKSFDWKAEMEADSNFQRIFPNATVVDDLPGE